MRFVRPNVPAGNSSSGYVGVPQSREWIKEWIENKGRWVLLDCGHKLDINDRALTIIKTFEGCEVGCEQCNRFATVVKTLKTKNPPARIPDEPLF